MTVWARNVMPFLATALVLFFMDILAAQAPSDVKRKIDSLFVIASSGEVKYRDQNEPAMDSIAALGARAVPFLIDKFTTKSARERWTIIWTLQRIGSPAVPDLVRALRRDDALVVSRVAWALGDIKDSTAVPPLIEVAGHRDWTVREQVHTAFGKIKNHRADDAVMLGLKDSVGLVRKAAAFACGQLRILESVPFLVSLLADDFYGARLGAAEALPRIDSSLALEAISDSLDSSRPLIGHLGCMVLGRIGSPKAVDLLLLQAKSPDPERRAHAARALVVADPEDHCSFRSWFFESETDPFTRLKVQSAIEALGHAER